MDTYLIYVVEGYESYDKKTATYKNVIRMEVIAPDEKTALKKAKTMMQAPHYKVWGAYEKQVTGDFTAEEKKSIIAGYQKMERLYSLQISVIENQLSAKQATKTNEKPKSM